MGSSNTVDAQILATVCWCICGLGYFFLITTIIHFCCTNWIDPRIPMPKSSKKWLYFISAHILRVINLIIAIADMTFEQLADHITSDNTRVLGPWVSCSISSRLRMSLFLSSFYTYALFCWYKVAIVTVQSTSIERKPSKNLPIIHKKSKKKKRRKNTTIHSCFGSNSIFIRRDHCFLDLLWYYIHFIFVVSIIVGNAVMHPKHSTNDPCDHQDNTHTLLAYIIAVLIEFISLIIIFVSPLYQLMKTKKRLFRNVFSNIKVRRNKSKTHKNSEQLIAAQETFNNNNNSTDSSSSPAQEEFISRIKSTICRNFISGFISILLFSGFMTIYTFGRMSGYKIFFTSGVGYVVVFTCYLLNYLCLTFSYQNHWPMLLPIICQPPWYNYKYFTQSKISLQENSNKINDFPHITPLILNDNDELIIGNTTTSAAIPIIIGSNNTKGDGSFESLLASSHLSATPKYHTLNVNDNIRMQKQYDEYLKKMANQQKTMNDENVTTSNSNDNIDSEEQKKIAKKFAPSQTQESIDRMKLPKAPKLSDKYNKLNDNEYENDVEYNDDESDDESSDEYDSEGIDSIKLRVGSYDAVNYKFSSTGYHDENQ